MKKINSNKIHLEKQPSKPLLNSKIQHQKNASLFGLVQENCHNYCRNLFSYSVSMVTPTWVSNGVDVMWDYIKPNRQNIYRSFLFTSFVTLQAYQFYSLKEQYQTQRKEFYGLLQKGNFDSEQFDLHLFNLLKSIALWMSASVTAKALSRLFVYSIASQKTKDLYESFISTNTFNSRNYLDSRDKQKINPTFVADRDVRVFIKETVSILNVLIKNIGSLVLAVETFSALLDTNVILVCLGAIVFIKAFTYICTVCLSTIVKKENSLRDQRVSDFEDILKSSESIAMLKGGEFELNQLRKSVNESLKYANLYTSCEGLLTFVHSLKGFASATLGIYLCKLKLISGEMNLAHALSTGEAVESLIDFITYSDAHADDVIEAQNAYDLIKALENEIELCTQNAQLRERSLRIVTNSQGNIMFEGVVKKPNGQIIFKGSIKLIKDEETNIYRLEGPSGIGKSTLIRVLAGLWPYVEGTLSMPENGGIIPQVPFIKGGNTALIDIIRYPETSKASQVEIDEIGRLLRQFGFAEDSDVLLHLTDKEWKISDKHVSAQWSKTLSGGEKQRIGIISFIIKKPLFLIMDEGTSALDPVLKAKAEKTIKEKLPDTLIVFVDHNPSGITTDRLQAEWFSGERTEINKSLKKKIQLIGTSDESLTRSQKKKLKDWFKNINFVTIDHSNNGFSEAVVDLAQYH